MYLAKIIFFLQKIPGFSSIFVFGRESFKIIQYDMGRSDKWFHRRGDRLTELIH